jgi:hypothetical protein
MPIQQVHHRGHRLGGGWPCSKSHPCAPPGSEP